MGTDPHPAGFSLNPMLLLRWFDFLVFRISWLIFRKNDKRLVKIRFIKRGATAKK